MVLCDIDISYSFCTVETVVQLLFNHYWCTQKAAQKLQLFGDDHQQNPLPLPTPLLPTPPLSLLPNTCTFSFRSKLNVYNWHAFKMLVMEYSNSSDYSNDAGKRQISISIFS